MDAPAKTQGGASAAKRPFAGAHGSASLPAGTELEREMISLFEEWWVKDRAPWMHANKDGARDLFTIAFLAGRESQRKQPAMSPNDLKLSDRRGWRDRCAAGGKAAAEAAGVTAAPVRCSAWLGVAVICRRDVEKRTLWRVSARVAAEHQTVAYAQFLAAEVGRSEAKPTWS